MERAKTVLEGLAYIYSKTLRINRLALTDERLRRLDEIFEIMISLETDPLMRMRWKTVRKIIMWLVSNDGAYRSRLLVFCHLIAKTPKMWKVKRREIYFK